jgi:hypothetical protein
LGHSFDLINKNQRGGALGTLTGIAAGISAGTIGIIVSSFGDLTGFLTMAAIAAISAALL